MNFFLRMLCGLLFLILLGCAPKNEEVVQCKMTCAQHFEFCKRNCVDNCPTCSWRATQSSTRNFTKYVKERKVQGKKVMRELNSYRDPLQCRKVTCNCLADLTICQQSCSGVIKKRLHSVPNCV